MPLTSGRIGSRRVSASETPSDISVATTNSAVATNSGPPNAASAGNLAASHSPRALAKKNTASGPSSSANLSSGLIGF